MVAGTARSIRPSRTAISIGSPQSRHGASISTVRPGNAQHAASASRPHWANHFHSPPTPSRYCVGRLLNGGNDAIRSVSGCSQFGRPTAISSRRRRRRGTTLGDEPPQDEVIGAIEDGDVGHEYSPL